MARNGLKWPVMSPFWACFWPMFLIIFQYLSIYHSDIPKLASWTFDAQAVGTRAKDAWRRGLEFRMLLTLGLHVHLEII